MDGGDEEEVEGRITGKRSELNSIRAQGFQVYFRVAMMGGLGDGGVCGSVCACVLACLLACLLALKTTPLLWWSTSSNSKNELKKQTIQGIISSSYPEDPVSR